jgi:Ca2+-binding EF-hand superfamily protein
MDMPLWIKTLGLGGLCCAALAIASAQTQPPTTPGAKPGADKTSPANQNPLRFDAARFLKDHDTNGDGKLSKDELPAIAQKEFDQIDTNKDGFITVDELQQHADRMARQRPQLVEIVWYAIDIPEEPVTTQELQAAYDELRKLDTNKDGKIDEGELKAFREQRKQARVDAIFAALDRNKDGKISKDEARGLWADNFSQLDTNKDGFLDRQEVEAACATHHPAAGQGSPGSNPGRPNDK